MQKSNNIPVAGAQKFSLGCGYFTVFFLGQAIPILAIPHYQMTLGINPALLGLLMALPLFLASCFGVWFGHVSDRLHSRFGRRRPFMLFAALITALSYGFLWMPPTGTSDASLVIYFGCLSLVFQLASVVYSISLNSLVYESSSSAYERTQLMGFTTYFVKLGSLCYQWLYPLSTLGLVGGYVLGVQGVGWLLAIGVFLILGVMPAIYIKESSCAAVALHRTPPFYHSLRVVIGNKAMLFILTLTLLQMGGAAYAATMDYYLLVYYVFNGDIAAGALAKGELSTAYALISFASVPLVLYLARIRGRLNALVIIYLINILGGILKWFLFVPDIGLWILMDAILCGTLWSAMVILIPSMISELAHNQGQLEQASCSGIYASMHGWVLSISGVAVLLFSGITLEAIGFDAALGGQQAPATLFAMRVILSLGTLAFSLIALLLVKHWQTRSSNYQFLG